MYILWGRQGALSGGADKRKIEEQGAGRTQNGEHEFGLLLENVCEFADVLRVHCERHCC